MRLNLSEIIHVPGGKIPFKFKLDLSDLDFYGRRPITEPVAVSGEVRNTAGALVLTAEANTVLHCTCDRCLREFTRPKHISLELLLAAELAGDEENDEIVLLEGDTVDVGDLITTAMILQMETKTLCSENCPGLCPKCGRNLNDGPCGCGKEPDPRMAALGKLLDRQQP